MREEGYYWVKIDPNWNWDIGYWQAIIGTEYNWRLPSDPTKYSDQYFSEINENRILPPQD